MPKFIIYPHQAVILRLQHMAVDDPDGRDAEQIAADLLLSAVTALPAPEPVQAEDSE